MPPIALSAPGAYASTEPETREEAAGTVLFSFMSGIIHAVVTNELEGMDSELSRYRTSFRRGSSPVSELWWNSLISIFRPVTVQGPTEDMMNFVDEIHQAGGTTMPAFGVEEMPPAEGKFKLVLRLEPPLGEQDTTWGISFWVDSDQEAGLRLPARSIWAHPERDLDRGKCTTPLRQSSYSWPSVKRLNWHQNWKRLCCMLVQRAFSCSSRALNFLLMRFPSCKRRG